MALEIYKQDMKKVIFSIHVLPMENCNLYLIIAVVVLI